MEHSFSISEVGKVSSTVSIEVQTEVVPTLCCDTQTDSDVFVEEYRLCEEDKYVNEK